jgi:hypothetical protein
MMPAAAALLLAAAAAQTTPVAQAEKLAEAAIAAAAQSPEAALADARKALSLTADFDPTAFVRPGRKGEVVEDAYEAARQEYRRHRSLLYEAVGECQARAGRPLEAARYLRRAVLLERRPTAVMRLAAALVPLGRGREALDLLMAGGGDLSPQAIDVAQQAAESARIPSLQAEIDRVRLLALDVNPKVVPRDGPIKLAERVRLSTGGPFKLAEAPTLMYVAEPSCKTCSADLEALRRVLPRDAQPLVLPIAPDLDEVLRRTLMTYRINWPVLLGAGLSSREVSAPSVFVVARQGWSAAIVRPEAFPALPRVLQILGRSDLMESRPRPAWNLKPVDRTAAATAAPALLPEGLAPGEDDPAPEAFTQAVAAYQAGQAAKALGLFESLEAKGDGWLLPPEARLDRARCMAALGRREEARRLLLRTGDSRFQEAVDRALEQVGSKSR